MAWNSIDLPGASIETVDSSQVFPLGTKCTARNTAASTGWVGEFVYMAGVASCAASDWVLLNYDNYTVSLLGDTNVGPVGLSLGATIASTFGWFQVRGKGTGKLAASCADNAQLYTTATAGVVDDALSGQFQIYGARAASGVTSAAAGEVEINYQVVAGPDAA